MTDIQKSNLDKEFSFADVENRDWRDETSAGSKVSRFPTPHHWSIVGNAITRILGKEDDPGLEEAVEQAINTLMVFWKVLGRFDDSRPDLSLLVPLIVAFPEDRSILLEWIYPEFRIGFSFEQDILESNWYMVSTDKHGDIACSGLLNESNTINMVALAIVFALLFAR